MEVVMISKGTNKYKGKAINLTQRFNDDGQGGGTKQGGTKHWITLIF